MIKRKSKKKLKSPSYKKRNESIRIYLKVAGFTAIGRKRWIKALRDVGLNKPFPVVLPQIFEGIDIGEKLKISSNENASLMVHFAAHRKDNLKIVFPTRVFRKLPIEKHKIYAFEFNKKNKIINILGE